MATFFEQVEARFAPWWNRHMIKVLIAVFGVVFLLVYFSPAMFKSIAPGHAGVLWERFDGGTLLNQTYAEGFHFIWPWDEMYQYNVQLQEITDALEARTADGHLVSIVWSTRFYPNIDHLPRLHQRVGPDYVEKIVRPIVVSSVRRVLTESTSYRLSSGGETGLFDAMNREVKDHLDPDFITLYGLVIEQVELPE